MGLSVSVTVESDLPEAPEKLRHIVAGGLAHAVEEAVKQGAQEARRVRTFRDRTGHLYASIYGHVDSVHPMGADGVLEAGESYASYVEGGTHPHVIEAKRAAALHWIGDDGESHFAVRVNHPGTKAMPFMGPGAVRARQALEAHAQVAADAASKI